jgi:pyruvate ferredoxin oxidoreductase alpha subunit
MSNNIKGIEVSIAMAEAVAQIDVDVIAAYPITPQTHIVEHLSDIVADGDLDAEFVAVDSEQSAMSVCCGSSAVGARTFTSTSSQGLALMAEIFFITSAMRLPVVMALANRSLSGPLSIWDDHSDTMMVRDGGWIHIFVENGQESYDSMFCGFRIAEDKDVMLPLAVNFDGFILSHVIEPIEFVENTLVKKYLPEFKMKNTLHPDNPVSMGCFAMPEIYTEAQVAKEKALTGSYSTIVKAWKEWGDLTGRYYNPIETYKADDAEYCLVTMGSYGEMAVEVIDRLRKEGKKVGVIKIRLWRPFPFEDFFKVALNKKTLIIIDRAISFGGPGGPLAIELRSALYQKEGAPAIVNYVVGLAGRDTFVEDFMKIIDDGIIKAKDKNSDLFEVYGVRE